MNINSATRVTYTYQPSDPIKKTSLASEILEPLRALVGAIVWRILGKLDLSQEKKAQIKSDKETFISTEKAQSLTLCIEGSHKLDGIAIGRSCSQEPKYTVVFFGLQDNYESHLQSMRKLARDTGTIVVSFNYRGTCESTGTPNGIKDYIADGKAFVEYLKSKDVGAKPENILIYGHSLGGGVAAKVKEELKLPGPILSESSFSNFKLAVLDKKGAFTAWIIKKAGWNINSVKALEHVQPEKLGIIVNLRDRIINYKKVSLCNVMEKKYQRITIGTQSVSEDEKEIKEAGWAKHLRDSHQMIMDQPLPSEIKIPDELKNKPLANQLVKLNRKYAEEDKIAYEEMVKMIKTMLGI